MKSRIHEIVALFLVLRAASFACSACGPDFPNTLLVDGDSAVLTPPVLNFAAELERMDLPKPLFLASPPTNRDYAEQSRNADLADLREALAKANVPEEQRDKIIEAQAAARKKFEDPANTDAQTATPPDSLKIQVPAGLPPEFAQYFRGLIAWREGKTNDARAEWLALLQLPESERRYRTTWAAFMLGRALADDAPEKAVEHFQHVRQFAKKGFPDSLGLAASSLGWEAQVSLEQKNFARAFDLYLQQYASGDPTAVNSLRFAARAAIQADPDTLLALAKDNNSRRVITAFVIATYHESYNDIPEQDLAFGPWIDALDRADIRNVEEAGKLALAAYQNGNLALAQRWINRSLSTPISQWLQAKLLLRAGKTDRAAEALTHLTALFPLEPRTNDNSSSRFEDGLYMDYRYRYPDNRDVPSQLLAELGALHLARREYRESLDCLLRSGYWMDAAYIADNVLTVDELKAYVDENWPLPDGGIPPDEFQPTKGDWERRSNRVEIRHLLARRLTRLERGHEARPYFPPVDQTSLDLFLTNWEAGNDESRSTEDRAQSLFAAAKIARTNGMNLMGTELYPDWHIYEGDYDWGITAERRVAVQTNLLRPTADELARCNSSLPQPDSRFHYRYIAAGIAWQSAELMPNNSDETAKILWTAGCWLKNRDPEGADRFYKALVRRCRKTAMGEEADRIRWFPELDDSGNIIPGPTRRKEKPPPEPPADTNAPVQPPVQPDTQ